MMCNNCGYKWKTKSRSLYPTCPHCMRKTSITEPKEQRKVEEEVAKG